MHVCIVSFVAPVHKIGGLQDVMHDTALELARRGHSIDVITAAHPDRRLADEEGGVRYHYVPEPANIPGRPGRNPAWLAGTAAVFEALHAESPVDIVHSESSSARALIPICRRLGVPVVVRVHGNFLGALYANARNVFKTRSFRQRLRELKILLWAVLDFAVNFPDLLAFRPCIAVILSRQQVIWSRLSHLTPRRNIRVVPNGIDAHVFQPEPPTEARALLKLPDDSLVFAVIGQLNADKGVDVAIDAFSIVHGRLARSSLLAIVGDGPERPALEALATERGVDAEVLFAGARPPAEIPLWLNACDVFLFPTRRDEAAPLILLQALSSATPVAASESGSVPEVIDRPGSNGVLVPRNDPRALADAIGRLSEDPQLRQNLGEAGRQRVLDGYTTASMVDRLLAVYGEATRRSGRRPRC